MNYFYFDLGLLEFTSHLQLDFIFMEVTIEGVVVFHY